MGLKFWGRRKNSVFTTKSTIKNQMSEPRPLPLGRTEFEEWSNRIISGALLPGVTDDSQKWTLANMLLHLGPTVDHECDGYFIKSLRKYAINQVADALRTEIRDAAKIRLEKEEEAKKLKVVSNGEVVPTTQKDENKILAD